MGPAMDSTNGHNHHDGTTTTCPTCGTDYTLTADLENRVQVLTQQSMESANTLASFEAEIHQLRHQLSAATTQAATAAQAPPTRDGSSAAQPQQKTQQPHTHSVSVDEVSTRTPPTLARFASFRMGGRKPSTTPSSNPSVDLGDLQGQLARETAARVEAEKKCEQANGELEDLSAQLFEQANEMVATERRARAKLEERVQVLEQRDKDKSRRLERIESGLRRLERVKALLGT